MDFGLLGSSILHISRIFGVAPFSSLSTLQVSRSYAIFGKVLAVITSNYIVILLSKASCYLKRKGLSFVIHMLIEIIYSWDIRIPFVTITIIRWISYGVLILTVSFGMVTGSRRIEHMGEQLVTLNQINTKVGQRNEGAIKKGFLIFIILTFQIIRVVLHITLTITNISQYFRGTDIPESVFNMWFTLHMLLEIEYIICDMIILQLVCFIWKVLSTLLTISWRLEKIITEISNSCQFMLNKKLPKLAWEGDQTFLYKFCLNCPNRINIVEDTNSRTTRKETILKLIRELGNHLIYVCDIVKATNEEEGALMGLLVIFFFLHLEINLFIIVMWTMDKKKIIFNSHHIVTSFIKFISHGGCLVLFAEPCHRISAELQHIHILINTLRSRISSDADASFEVEMFQRLSSTNTASYSPLDLGILDRSSVIKVIGGVITSLTLILSYGPDHDLIYKMSCTGNTHVNSTL